MMLICSLMAVVVLGSLIGMVLLAEADVYASKKTWKAQLENKADEAYALWAVANYHGGIMETNCDTSLEGTGFSYGIIKGKYNNQDLNDGASYAERNFTGALPEDYQVRTFYLGEQPSYYLSNRLLGRNTYSSNDAYDRNELTIEGIGYDLIDNSTYIYAVGEIYPVYEEFAYAVDDDYSDGSDFDAELNQAYEQIWKNHQQQDTTGTTDEVYYYIEDKEGDQEDTTEEEQTYDYLPSETITYLPSATIPANEDLLYFGERGFPSMAAIGWNQKLYLSTWNQYGSLEAKNVADLSSIHDELKALKTKDAKLESSTMAYVNVPNANNQYYTVVFFRDQQVDLSGGFFHGNLYAQVEALSELIPVLAKLFPVVGVVAFAIAIWMLVLLMFASGHRYGTEELVAGFWDRVPVDLMFVLTAIMEGFLFMAAYAMAYYSYRTVYAVIGGIFTTVIIFVGCLVGLGWLMTVACNLKLGHWWHNTIIYRLGHFSCAWWKRRQLEARTIGKSIHWNVRIWIIFFLFVAFEFFGLVLFEAESGLLFVWFLEKVLFGAALFVYLKNYAKVKDALLQMANGDLTVKVDTDKMPLDLLEQGDAINTIGDGLNTAVAERMKSERMKTELITNVSHDIKTPLTSIINYVDLLEKEHIENDTVKEYLEVLERQSKRLKKLIEDLIEASKAATGNIKFHMESVNARVLLNQSIGEFQDRLEQNGITLVTNMPEKDCYLWADNRYLWRVFDNLMNNIAKYAQPGTRAYVDLDKEEDKVCFTFRNTSKNELNISADELMERFVRGDASRNTEGNGLGLSIARSLTESMDGTMNLAIDGDLFKVILTFQTR